MPDSADPLRLFIGITLSPEVHTKVAEVLKRLQKGTVFTGARPVWVKSESLHLTLVFLGWLSPDSIDAIKKTMSTSTSANVPFSLRLQGIELFPTPRQPKAISVGIRGDLDRLCTLRDKLAGSCRDAGFNVENRPFNPHLTLGRIKSQKGLAGLRDVVQTHKNFECGQFDVSAIKLFQSVLHADGAQYQCLFESPISHQLL